MSLKFVAFGIVMWVYSDIYMILHHFEPMGVLFVVASSVSLFISLMDAIDEMPDKNLAAFIRRKLNYHSQKSKFLRQSG